jgi:proteasome lid subunit RPN8/RPN11
MTASDPATDTYGFSVLSTLHMLGSPTPVADLAKTGDYWKHCQAAGISPEVCAATIYSGTRHVHNVSSTTIREGEDSERSEPGRSVASSCRAGSGEPIQGSSLSSESPTREEWEIIIRRSGSMNAIVEAAGRKPDEVIGNNVLFGGYYDDERAVAFARKMTKAGFVAMTGPRKPLVGLNEVDGGLSEPTAEEKSVYRWTEVWWQYPADATKFAAQLEKLHSTIVAAAFNRIARTNASGSDIKKVIGKHKWEGKYILDPKTVEKVDLAAEVKGAAAEGDPSAMGAASEPVEVIHEPAREDGRIPWRKVSRDPVQHEADMALAARHGVIKTPERVYALVGPELSKEDSEVFLVIPLNLRGELRGNPYECARGQRSRVSVDPADVLRAALDAGAEGYIVVHNHPTGKAKPSKADLELTDTLKAATKPYGKSLCMVDHVVVGHGEYFSIFENKMYKVKK